MTPLFLLLACSHEPPTRPARPPLADRVRYAVPERAETLPIGTLAAEVVPTPDSVQRLAPGVDARLVRWHVAPGDVVERGSPLAELVSPTLDTLRARADELAASTGQRSRQVELAEAARARGVGSTVQVAEARAAEIEARTAHDAAARTLRSRRDTLERNGSSWTWRAPAAGQVGELLCTLGSIDAAVVCLTLVQSPDVVLQVRVPERLLAAIDGPSSAQLTSADGRRWAFHEIARAPTIDPRTRSRTFRYASDGEVRPLAGTSGRARITVTPQEPVYTVPVEALTRFDDVPSVFAALQDGPLPRPVDVLHRDRETAWIRGVDAGQPVAVEGVFLLKSLALLEEG
jgi:multidrug efflux pump subunit AcrA (membrane-fusion protein)